MSQELYGRLLLTRRLVEALRLNRSILSRELRLVLKLLNVVIVNR